MENEITNNTTTGNYADQGNLLDVIEDDSFSYKGYQVVRGEFFAHINEPSVTFSGNKVSVNRTCLKKVPDFDYMQILVNPEAKKLAIRPCAEETKDSFRWCSANGKRTPKQVTCRVFFAKVFSLMGWDMSYRYKLLGKLIRSNRRSSHISKSKMARSRNQERRSIQRNGRINLVYQLSSMKTLFR